MHLRSVLPFAIAALTLLAVSTDAMAMLHPRLGRYMQRDPSGTSIALARFGGFAPRDAVRGQYPDGMNLHAAHHVLRGRVDPSGLDDVRIADDGQVVFVEENFWGVDGNSVPIGSARADGDIEITVFAGDSWTLPRSVYDDLDDSSYSELVEGLVAYSRERQGIDDYVCQRRRPCSECVDLKNKFDRELYELNVKMWGTGAANAGVAIVQSVGAATAGSILVGTETGGPVGAAIGAAVGVGAGLYEASARMDYISQKTAEYKQIWEACEENCY